MKQKILMLHGIVFILLFSACKKKEPEPTQPVIPTQNYTSQELTSSVGSLFWVIDGDTFALAECSPDYSVGEYHVSFNFEVGVEYDFKILRGIPPSLTSYELKNEGTIKFIDGYSSTDVYGGVSSVVINQGATWTYSITYAQCGSIQNQLNVHL